MSKCCGWRFIIATPLMRKTNELLMETDAVALTPRAPTMAVSA